MYVGRIVAVGNTKNNRLAALYRVSSRSFANRRCIRNGETLAVVPVEGCERDIRRNPYITYNCLRYDQRYGVVSNGTQTDPIMEKLTDGTSARDALAAVLPGMDYEHDHLKTPRIAAVVDKESRAVTLGTVKSDALLVRTFKLKEGEVVYLATYEQDVPDDKYREADFDVSSAEEACDLILERGIFKSLELPVLSACALETETGFDIAFKNLK